MTPTGASNPSSHVSAKGPKEASWTFLAIGLVLSLVGMWTGLTEVVAGWVGGHIVDLIPDYAERSQ